MQFESFIDRMLKKLENLVDQYMIRIFEPVLTATQVEGYETKQHFQAVPEGPYKLYRSGDRWGCEYGNIWVKLPFTVPEAAKGSALYICENTGAQETLAYVNGVPRGMFSLVNTNFPGLQNNVLLTACAQPGEHFDIALECYAWHYEASDSPYQDLGIEVGQDSMFVKTFRDVSVCRMNQPIRDFVINLRMLLSLARNRNNAFLKAKAINLLEQVFKTIVLFPYGTDYDEIQQSVERSNAIMETIYTGNNAGEVSGYVGLIGHSHMDTAWLWPMAETVRKCARTFSNALNLMEQYPDYRFVQSSVLHTYWMEKLYPSIYADLAQRVQEGRYEINGGSWVEFDCNITGGEFMIRQFMAGQTYLKEKFGRQSDCFWLPDTFGYSAAIPQIMKGCGIDTFFTTKMDWNEHNKFPYESFVWRGLDGTEVITHLNVMHTELCPTKIYKYLDALQEKQADSSRLVAFGYGDGGGGPTEVMVEQAERITKIDGLPKAEYTTVSEFAKRLAEKKEQLPVYDGELYLELHRGTLTQMHDIKRNNRLAETAFGNMELLTVLTGADHSPEAYDTMLKVLLENQFHDILPGSSIRCVHEKSLQDMGKLLADVKAQTGAVAAQMLKPEENSITLWNPLSFARNDCVYLADPGTYVADARNQQVEDVFGRKLLAVAGVTLDGYEAKSFALTQDKVQTASVFSYDGKTLITPYAQIEFDENGYIGSFVDKQSGRQLRRQGAAALNSFYLGEDIAVRWDAWDVEYDQKLKMNPVTGFKGRSLVSDGPVQLRLRSVFEMGKSVLTQDMIVYADSPRVDFHTKLDWQEKHKLLKVSFDLDILTRTAKHEIQFGHLDRPTTENSKEEAAKFEVCNHRWTDISENRFGVAVLNDCKYGVSVRGSDVRLSLHRGGCRPDYTGDAGVHEMTYSLLPHGSFDSRSVIQPGYMLNNPVQMYPGKLVKTMEAPVKISAENVICEAVKPAQADKNSYVLRLYEAERNKTATTLVFPKDVKKVYLTDMLEHKLQELPLHDGTAQLTFGAFQIKTLLCER